MAIRTTAEAVQGIADIDETINLDPFIETASSLVDWIDEVNAPGVLTDLQLEKVERWLSAHFYHILLPQANMESVRGVAEQFAMKVDLGLNQTRYGQMAMLLDFSGSLKSLNESGGAKPSMFWLGTKRCRS